MMKDDFRDRSHIKTIEGSRTKPRAGRRKALDQADQVLCWRCDVEIGVETSAVVQIVLAPRRRPEGRKTGGTKIWACAHCLMRGEITELINA